MKYPEHLLVKNQAGYSVAKFSLDTLGLPRDINIRYKFWHQSYKLLIFNHLTQVVTLNKK